MTVHSNSSCGWLPDNINKLTLLSVVHLAFDRLFECSERLEGTGVLEKRFRAHFLLEFNNNSVHSLFGVEIQIVATQQLLIGFG